MSVTAFTANTETAGKVPYVKESVLLVADKPTKIILEFIASFKEEDYWKLLAEEKPSLTILTPLKVQKDSAALLLYRLVQVDFVNQMNLPYEHKYLSSNDKEVGERYLREIKEFVPTDELSDDWVGLCWKPRREIDAFEFYVPLKSKLMQISNTEESSKTQEIRIELPKCMPTLSEKTVNIGLAVEFETQDIPSVKDTIMATSIEFYNWARTGTEFFERSHVLIPTAGELWVQYPLNTFVMSTYPSVDGLFFDKKEDERIAQEISYGLFNIRRLTDYMPAETKTSIRWDIDKHIKILLDNEVSFVSTAFLLGEFQEFLRRVSLSRLELLLADMEKRILDYVSEILASYET